MSRNVHLWGPEEKLYDACVGSEVEKLDKVRMGAFEKQLNVAQGSAQSYSKTRETYIAECSSREMLQEKEVKESL